MALIGGTQIVLIPDHHAEQEHVACTLPIVRAHRFWFGMNLAFGWPRRLYDTVPGWSRPIYRPKPVSYLMPNGAIAMTRTVYEQLARQAVIHRSPFNLFR